MSIRTDLAIELEKGLNGELSGVKKSEYERENIAVSKIEINSDEAAQKLGKPKGKYITLQFEELLKISDYNPLKNEIKEALEFLLPQGFKSLLVVGLGNREITCDSIGPTTAESLLATRHIAGAFAEKLGLFGLKSVAVTVPNVLGKTGIEATEITAAAVEKINPDAVIVIDALAAGSITRLFRTVQLCNTGISPGSGVKNARRELSEKSLGVPVIAVGVPTAVDALNLSYELCGREPKICCDMVVTPKDSDLLSHRISEILASALNEFLQPDLEPEILAQLV